MSRKGHGKRKCRYIGLCDYDGKTFDKINGIATWECPKCRAIFQCGIRKANAWCDGIEFFLGKELD